MRLKSMTTGPIIGLLVALLILLASFTGLFEPLELKTLDLRFKIFNRDRPLDDRIRLIFIDDYTLKQVGQEPFPRDLLALLIDTLSKEPYRAKEIGFDLLFAEKTNPENDALLADCTEKARNVYHCFCFHFGEGSPLPEHLSEKFGYLSEISPVTSQLYSATNLTTSLPDILSAAKEAGHTNVFPDADGVIRRVPLVIEYQGKLYPNLALQMACGYLNISKEQVKIVPGKYIILSNRIKIPIDKKGQMLINFASPELKGDSFIQVLQMGEGQRPLVNLYDYKDKIILVGTIATGKGDVSPTPLSAYYPGVGIFANVIDNILQQNFLIRLPMWIQGIILIIIGLIMGVFLPRLTPLKQIGRSGLFLLFYILITLYAFWIHHLWLDQVAPVAVILFSYVFISLWSYVKAEEIIQKYSSKVKWLKRKIQKNTSKNRKLEEDMLMKKEENKQLKMEVEEKLKIEQMITELRTTTQAEANQRITQLQTENRQLEDKLSEMKESEQEEITQPDLEAEIIQAFIRSLPDDDTRKEYSKELCSFLSAHLLGFSLTDYNKSNIEDKLNPHKEDITDTAKNHLRLLVQKNILTKIGEKGGYQLHKRFCSSPRILKTP